LSQPFALGNSQAYVSASIGITLSPTDAEHYEDLIRFADQAMYAAKNKGRNMYCFFTPAMQKKVETHMHIAHDLHHALANNQFTVYYQPIVDLARQDKVVKAEALIRWMHPTKGMIMPMDFISIAEETGVINDIGDWIFKQAAQQTQKWQQDYLTDFQVSVNKSPVQFHSQNGLHNHWTDYLRQLDMPHDSVVVEITEGLLLDDSHNVAKKLLHFKECGIQVAIDDFGTGYSALSYLKKFHIEFLKIDQSFTRNLTQGSSDLALCEAIIVMAHKLGIKVIAEGIETQQQRDFLAQAGCDYGQGYLFAKPMPGTEFERLLKPPHDSQPLQVAAHD
jgi:EAL domain-containing protein (putative c-di-GMP-specific phosphodiesterase class I)